MILTNTAASAFLKPQAEISFNLAEIKFELLCDLSSVLGMSEYGHTLRILLCKIISM